MADNRQIGYTVSDAISGIFDPKDASPDRPEQVEQTPPVMSNKMGTTKVRVEVPDKVIPNSAQYDHGVRQISYDDPRFYLGKDGIIHQFGTGVISAFIGPQAGGLVGGLIGTGESAGLDALDNRSK